MNVSSTSLTPFAPRFGIAERPEALSVKPHQSGHRLCQALFRPDDPFIKRVAESHPSPERFCAVLKDLAAGKGPGVPNSQSQKKASLRDMAGRPVVISYLVGALAGLIENDMRSAQRGALMGVWSYGTAQEFAHRFLDQLDRTVIKHQRLVTQKVLEASMQVGFDASDLRLPDLSDSKVNEAAQELIDDLIHFSMGFSMINVEKRLEKLTRSADAAQSIDGCRQLKDETEGFVSAIDRRIVQIVEKRFDPARLGRLIHPLGEARAEALRLNREAGERMGWLYWAIEPTNFFRLSSS